LAKWDYSGCQGHKTRRTDTLIYLQLAFHSLLVFLITLLQTFSENII